MLSQTTPTLPTSVWEYGVSIGVIICSFALIWRLISAGGDKFESLSKNHNETVKEIQSKHKEERDEWKQEAYRREDRIIDVCDKLIKSIHDKKA